VQKTDQTVTEEFKKQCRKHNLKITPQRTALYNIVKNNKTHPTAQDIYRKVIHSYPTISFDTVNRTLNTFAEIGIIDIVEGYGEPRKFDPDRGPHHHLHCIRCGKIVDFHDDAFDTIDIPPHLSEQFEVISARVVINGICRECKHGET
jgi:Fur family transcriptional regulator, peroxide stress response regulator